VQEAGLYDPQVLPAMFLARFTRIVRTRHGAMICAALRVGYRTGYGKGAISVDEGVRRQRWERIWENTTLSCAPACCLLSTRWIKFDFPTNRIRFSHHARRCGILHFRK